MFIYQGVKIHSAFNLHSEVRESLRTAAGASGAPTTRSADSWRAVLVVTLAGCSANGQQTEQTVWSWRSDPDSKDVLLMLTRVLAPG